MTAPELRVQVFLQRPGFTLDVDLELPGSGVTVLFGHSGSGKTTVLRCIAGLEKTQRGAVSFNGEIWQNGSKFVPPHRRAIGYVFQEASLFDHLSARQNLEFALKRASPGRNPVSLDHVVNLLGLERILANYPAELSGGERQRVAIARALLINPRLLLMDEPLASLDVARKQEILPYLEELKQALELPIIYVSHSPDEVARLADHLVAMADGAAVASGTLTETLSRLDFPLKLGEETGVVLEAKISARDERWQLAKVSFSGGELWFRDNGYALGSLVRVRILARDISLSLDNHGDSSIINALPARVLEVGDEDHPGLALVRLQVADSILIARVTRRSAHNLGLAPGTEIWAQIKSVAIVQ